MHWPARMRDEDGFTLPELMIGMVIMSLLIVAIAGALIVSLKTTGATEQRLHESQDVLITSSYVANDVQSASTVNLAGGTTDCSGSFTTLVTFTYASAAHPTAVYKCGTASNGETQITRTFNGVTPIVVAHFAGTARPNVTVAYDSSTPPVPMSVTMRFTKPSDCSLVCTYTLFGSRRSYNPASVTTGGNPLPADVVLLSTGAASPLWVQGSCPDPGTTTGCIVDSTKTALPISDVQTTGWGSTPLWQPLSDADTTTAVTSAAGSKAEARVLLGSVDPPDAGVTPTLEFHASAASNGAIKVAASIYDGNTLLVQNANIGNVNQPGSFDWTLSTTDAAKIPPASYAHLTIGFSAPSAKGTDSLRVDGVAFDTFDLSAVGLLTVKGPLYIDSQLSSAVRLTGKKTATKISITSPGDFRIWSPGACSGCNHNTVSCPGCTWVGQQPWTSYTTSIPDPLRSLPAPAIPSAGSCSGTPRVCTPGSYNSFAWTSDTQLTPGVYYLTSGMSITGSASLTCPTCTGGQGVLLYIAGGAVTFAGSARVNLPAATTGLYKGILMFQARSDTNELKFAGNSGGSPFCTMGGTQYGNCLNGIVYVPKLNAGHARDRERVARHQGGRRAKHQGFIERDDRLGPDRAPSPPHRRSRRVLARRALGHDRHRRDHVRGDPYGSHDDDQGVGDPSDRGDDRLGRPFGGRMGERHRPQPLSQTCNGPGTYTFSGLPAPSGYVGHDCRCRVLGRRCSVSYGNVQLSAHTSFPPVLRRRQGSATDHDLAHVVRRAGDGDGPGHEAGDRMNVRDEKGQALILALGFLMFFGLVIGVLLSLASSSVSSPRASSESSARRSTRRTARPTPRSTSP